MKLKGLLVALVLLAGLAGLIKWSNNKQDAAGAASGAKAVKTVKLLSIPEDEFQNVRIQKAAGETQAIERDNGKWRVTEPKPLPADQDSVAAIVSSLSVLNADAVVDENATDLKPYGLDKPAYDIQIKHANGRTTELLLGDDTPTGSGAYAKVAGDPRVLTVAGTVKSGFDKKPDDLRDKHLILFDQDKLTRVSLQAKGPALEFAKDAKGEWQILKPSPLRADSSAVNGLVEKLRDAKMDLGRTADPAKEFPRAARVATATVTDSRGNHNIEIRKDKDNDYFARSSDVLGEFRISNDVGEGVDKSLEDFRNKKLFDFGFSDPGKVELMGVAYEKSGDKWMSGGKAMDNSTVQKLIDKLRDLSATNFAEKAPGDLAFTAIVTTEGGKQVEKVTVRKQGADYFAQREGDASIYHLDNKSIEGLEAAAKDVKPAAAPDNKKKK